MHHWLIKSEPETFSFDDLWAAPGRRTMWDGVRNYQARNTLRDDMRKGDRVLFYHSNAAPAGVVGTAEVVREAYPDPTQFEAGHPHQDTGSDPADPRWVAVDVRALARLPRTVSLEEIKSDPVLAAMVVAQRGSRLSVTPVRPEEWERILALAATPPQAASRPARATDPAQARAQKRPLRAAQGPRSAGAGAQKRSGPARAGARGKAAKKPRLKAPKPSKA